MANERFAYVDVFVSHKAEDTDKAQRLKKSIESLGYSCYIDAQDRKLSELVNKKDAKAMAEHIRSKLRGCQCLIFLYSELAIQSKWMPWELGFFDGRWGNRPVGIYISGETAKLLQASHDDSSLKEPSNTSASKFSIQEYLEMYQTVTNTNLADFLHRSTSTTMLLNRADVDVDRLMTLVTGAMQNPVDFCVGYTQYLFGMSRYLLEQWGIRLSAFDGVDLFAQAETWLGMCRKIAGTAIKHSERPSLLFDFTPTWREMHEKGMNNSQR